MTTIKLPYSSDKKFYELLEELQRQYSIIVRYSYNRFLEGHTEKEIRKLCKNLNNIGKLNAWMVQCAIKEGYQIYRSSENRKVVFGGKYLFQQWIKTKNQLWLEKWRNKRLFPLIVQGERLAYGNRNFKLDIIENNRIIFKYKRNEHYEINLPKLRNNYKKQLFTLQHLCENKLANFMIRIDKKYLRITFDEGILREQYNPIRNRLASIDMNPNYIGFIIKDFNSNKILWKEIISLKRLNDLDNNMNLASKHPKRIKLNNIRKHLIYEISKRIANISKHFKVEGIVVEDLRMNPTDNRLGRRYNRLVNNQWQRNKLIFNLRKRCKTIGIKFIQVYPQYSSTIGCIQYPHEVDSIGAALELARRGYELINYKKGKSVIYPTFDKITLSRQWKDEMAQLILSSNGWVDLHKKIKKSGLRYRFLLSDLLQRKNHDAVFNLHNTKKYILLYQFVL